MPYGRFLEQRELRERQSGRHFLEEYTRGRGGDGASDEKGGDDENAV
jgi:hypothetical protein